MALNSEQKQYIKKNLQDYSPKQMAEDLGIREKEIIEYLKKQWRPDKFQKYIRRFTDNKAISEFSFKKFFSENKIILAILSILVIVSYFGSINNAFVSDDIPTIVGEPNIGNFFNYIFSSPFGIPQRILYFIGFELGGLNPAYFRIPNILFHLGTTLSAFLVLSLLAPRQLAIMAAAIFAVHPILVESVTWISGNPYSQNGFFFMMFFAFYILAKQKPKLYYVSLAFFLLSISVLPRSFVMLGVIFLYELFFGNLKENWKKFLPIVAVCFIIAISLFSQVAYRETALKNTYYLEPGRDSLLVKIPTSIYKYFQLIIWPDKLSLYQTEMLFTPWEYRLTVLVFLIYIGLIVYFYHKKNKLLSFWLIFFIIPLLPTLSPLRIAWAVAERYDYIGYLGFFVFIAYLFYKVSEYKHFKTIVYVIFWFVIAALSTRTIIRNNDWKSEETLWFATAKTSPSGSTIHNNLGNIYFQKGNYDKAIEEFGIAIQINPAYGDAYHNMGNTYYQIQKLPEAAQSYTKALELNPRLWQSHQNLAAIYYGQQWYDLANDEIKKAIELNPNDEGLKKNASLIESALNSGSQPQAAN